MAIRRAYSLASVRNVSSTELVLRVCKIEQTLADATHSLNFR